MTCCQGVVAHHGCNITVLQSCHTTRPVFHSQCSYLGLLLEICQPWQHRVIFWLKSCSQIMTQQLLVRQHTQLKPIKLQIHIFECPVPSELLVLVACFLRNIVWKYIKEPKISDCLIKFLSWIKHELIATKLEKNHETNFSWWIDVFPSLLGSS